MLQNIQAAMKPTDNLGIHERARSRNPKSGPLHRRGGSVMTAMQIHGMPAPYEATFGTMCQNCIPKLARHPMKRDPDDVLILKEQGRTFPKSFLPLLHPRQTPSMRSVYEAMQPQGRKPLISLRHPHGQSSKLEPKQPRGFKYPIFKGSVPKYY